MSADFGVDEIAYVIPEAQRMASKGKQSAFLAITQLRELYPNAHILVLLDGYDDDPRELWQIPKARAFMIELRQYLRRMGVLSSIHQDTLDVMTACSLVETLGEHVVTTSQCEQGVGTRH